MIKWRCYDCKNIWAEDELEMKQVCLEAEYGVAGEFGGRTYSYVSCCPVCHGTDFDEEEVEEETEEEEE